MKLKLTERGGEIVMVGTNLKSKGSSSFTTEIITTILMTLMKLCVFPNIVQAYAANPPVRFHFLYWRV